MNKFIKELKIPILIILCVFILSYYIPNFYLIVGRVAYDILVLTSKLLILVFLLVIVALLCFVLVLLLVIIRNKILEQIELHKKRTIEFKMFVMGVRMEDDSYKNVIEITWREKTSIANARKIAENPRRHFSNLKGVRSFKSLNLTAHAVDSEDEG